jgi:predicted cupin superfamily sugar epimerase
MHAETKYIIDKLNLIRLVDEGGYYRETYRSNQSIHISSCDEVIKDDVYHYSKLEENSSDIRAVSTLIYYLLDSDQFSAFHKVRFDEI